MGTKNFRDSLSSVGWDLHTRLEISMFTHYKDIKSNTKCRNWGGLGL